MARGGQEAIYSDIEEWRQSVRHWFPRLQERTYLVPPVYMNRVRYETVQFAGETINVTQRPVTNLPRGASPALQDSHVRDDQTQQRILHCLQKLAETQGEPMVVISQLQFGDYLSHPCYAPAASMLPRPRDLKHAKKHKGDFDLLIIHKHYGLIVAEIKTVGDNFHSLGLTKHNQDNLVAVKVQQMVKQLDKAGDVLSHLVSDRHHKICVRKTLMLPNITRQQLHRVLCTHQNANQALCQCLGVGVWARPADYCLCADDLTNKDEPYDVNDDVIKRLKKWWTMLCAKYCPSLADDVYEDLVARFAGPATTVQVFWIERPPCYFRSEGEGVSETAFRFTRITLHPHQLDTLNKNEPLVWLCGPPGTGKTLVLTVRAKDWWLKGRHVHIFSTHDGSLAASHLIYHLLLKTVENKDQRDSSSGVAGRPEERIHLHEFNFRSLTKGKVETAVKELVAAVNPLGPLCVVVDEAYRGEEFAEFCTELCRRVSALRLWAASMYYDRIPPGLTEVQMTEPLRTPPVITKEVRQAPSIQGRHADVHTRRAALIKGQHPKVYDYTESPTPPPCTGPTPKVIQHKGLDHSDGSPVGCHECGKELARVLNDLRVSVAGPEIADPGSSKKYVRRSSSIPAPLRYKDVFLLTAYDSEDLFDEAKDDVGNVTPASGVVRGLREAGVPVRVLKYGDSKAVRDVAVMEGGDEVVAAFAGTVSGLERPVVVWLQVRRTGTETVDEDFGRLMAISRTTAQLVRVDWPWDNHENDD